MYAIIIGCSGAIAMNLTVCIKHIEKQWGQQVMITVRKFSYLKRLLKIPTFIRDFFVVNRAI